MGKRLIKGIILCAIIPALILTGSTVSRCDETDGTGADATAATGVTWTYDEDTKTLTFSGEGFIPANASLDGHGDEPDWNKYDEKAKYIVIEDGITAIGDGAFYGFTTVQNITMADSVTSIGAWAFRSCTDLRRITLSKNLRTVGSTAFDGCLLLESIELPDGLKTMGAL